jgi:hypothetical protein
MSKPVIMTGFFRARTQPPTPMIKLIANYSKRLGLPGYSSHQFSISVEAELNNTDDVQAEASRLYSNLQSAVDQEIQTTGFVPGEGYGEQKEEKRAEWPKLQRNSTQNDTNGGSPVWRCSEKQKALIGKLTADHRLERGDIESLSFEMFGTSELHTLNKLQASGLIDRLIEDNGGKNRRGTTPAGWRGK